MLFRRKILHRPATARAKTPLRAVMLAGCLAGCLAAGLAVGPAAAQDVKSWQSALAKKIAAKHVYPRSALMREIEGSAKVKVTIDRSGAIQNFEVVEATGQKILDNAIPKMMKRLDPLPAPPGDMDDSRLTFIIPISWRLN